MPVSARVAWWGTAFLRGLVTPDEYVDAVLAGDATHVFEGTGGPRSLLEVTAAARQAGATALGAAFPAPGDPFGLSGPAAFSMAATESGEAVVALGVRTEPGIGWVPVRVGQAVGWTSYDAHRRPPPDLGDADRMLRSTVLDAANELARLDVAHWRPEVADELHDLRAGHLVAAPPGVPARAWDLARRALHLQVVIDLALNSEGGAVSVSELAARRASLVPLGAAARRALTAACSPDGWPDA
jgi:hypothetical protein